MIRLLTIFLFFAITSIDAQQALRTIPNEAFGLGERLEYKVGYQFVKAGDAYFHVQPKSFTYKGRPCYDIRFEVRSLKSLDWLYRVQDIYRTLVDIDGIYPYYFEQKIREGGYRKDAKAHFDHSAKKATVDDKSYPFPAFSHDIVSAFYFVRTMDLTSKKKGDVIQLKNFVDDSTYTLGVRIHGKQTVNVQAGTFNCIVVEPMVTKGGLFKSEGKILLWLTDDERKIPVKVSTKVLIGAIEAELTSFSGTRGPIKAKIK
ncbi:MAG: DUF3108 domain-containing protein [Candidatus Kapaibacteriota bacterium]